MAASHVSAWMMLSPFFNTFQIPSLTRASRCTAMFLRQSKHPLLPLLSTALSPAIHLNIPSLLGGMWEGILKAVPKKKTSHRKKRQRFLAGKGLKDVTALNRCSACGHVKRAHLLCPYCVKEIRNMFGKESGGKEAKTTKQEAAEVTSNI